MPQINLLKQTSRTENYSNVLYTGLVRGLFVAVLCLIGYYGWVFYQADHVKGQISKVELDIQQANKEISATTGKEELLTRQAQLKEITSIINSHPYWSGVFPALAKATLANSSYLSLKAVNDGNMNLGVVVPDLNELDKFLQVFNLPEFNKNFSDVRVSSISNIQQGNKILYQFDIRFKYNTALLQYSASN